MSDIFSPTISAPELVISPDLLRRYDVAGPRYTSYPTADRFVEAFGEADYVQALAQRFFRPDQIAVAMLGPLGDFRLRRQDLSWRQ